MGDKLDLLNRKAPVVVTLPPRKTLTAAFPDPDLDLDIEDQKPNYTNPNLYNYSGRVGFHTE
jgi:hypothetical protein